MSVTDISPAKIREYKGKSLIEVLKDYTVLDLETTGLDPEWDDIIEIGAIRIREGEIVDRFETLINPRYSIDAYISELTGITNEMLSTAPAIDKIFPEAISFIGRDVVVAHNANFDINFMYETCVDLSLPHFSNNFLDIMRLSRRLYPQLPHHRLDDVVSYLGISTDYTHHRALSDAEAAYLCYTSMKRYILDNGIDVKSLVYTRAIHVKASDVTTDKTCFDESSPIYNKVFVFTGVLAKMGRLQAMQIVVDMGGSCKDSVTKNTNYLVLGKSEYCTMIRGGKSVKQKRAEQLKLAGQDIEIISESVFYEMICAD